MTQLSDLETISSSNYSASQLMTLLSNSDKPILINEDGKALGVLLDIASYQKINDTLNMLTLINHSESAVLNGEVYNNSEVFAKLRLKTDKLSS